MFVFMRVVVVVSGEETGLVEVEVEEDEDEVEVVEVEVVLAVVVVVERVLRRA